MFYAVDFSLNLCRSLLISCRSRHCCLFVSFDFFPFHSRNMNCVQIKVQRRVIWMYVQCTCREAIAVTACADNELTFFNTNLRRWNNKISMNSNLLSLLFSLQFSSSLRCGCYYCSSSFFRKIILTLCILYAHTHKHLSFVRAFESTLLVMVAIFLVIANIEMNQISFVSQNATRASIRCVCVPFSLKRKKVDFFYCDGGKQKCKINTFHQLLARGIVVSSLHPKFFSLYFRVELALIVAILKFAQWWNAELLATNGEIQYSKCRKIPSLCALTHPFTEYYFK